MFWTLVDLLRVASTIRMATAARANRGSHHNSSNGAARQIVIVGRGGCRQRNTDGCLVACGEGEPRRAPERHTHVNKQHAVCCALMRAWLRARRYSEEIRLTQDRLELPASGGDALVQEGSEVSGMDSSARCDTKSEVHRPAREGGDCPPEDRRQDGLESVDKGGIVEESRTHSVLGTRPTQQAQQVRVWGSGEQAVASREGVTEGASVAGVSGAGVGTAVGGATVRGATVGTVVVGESVGIAVGSASVGGATVRGATVGTAVGGATVRGATVFFFHVAPVGHFAALSQPRGGSRTAGRGVAPVDASHSSCALSSCQVGLL